MNAAEGVGVLFVTAALSLGVHGTAAAAWSCPVPCAALARLLHQPVGLRLPEETGLGPSPDKSLWSSAPPCLHLTWPRVTQLLAGRAPSPWAAEQPCSVQFISSFLSKKIKILIVWGRTSLDSVAGTPAIDV